MKTYSVTELGNFDSITRVTLKEKLDLTGAEISANRLPAGTDIPFAHSHKRNEEIYIFTSGKGLSCSMVLNFQLRKELLSGSPLHV
jgi:mannose-6-phosphate isomerase-like protein (cupin superfamily)